MAGGIWFARVDGPDATRNARKRLGDYTPGALAGLKVRDFDKRTRVLTIGKDKNGNPRQLTIPQVIADFYEVQVKDKCQPHRSSPALIGQHGTRTLENIPPSTRSRRLACPLPHPPTRCAIASLRT
jgi:hypothetical protein